MFKGGTVGDAIKGNIKSLIETYPEVQFASIDSGLLELSMEKKMAPFEANEHRVAMFHRTDDSGDSENEEVLKTSARSYKSSDFSLDALKSFVDAGLNDEAAFKKTAVPTVKTRTKKSMEKAQKRAQDAAAKKSDYGGAQGGAGDSAPAGGSAKDARKVERERQRERAKKEREEREANMTPEEVAEAERKKEMERRRKIEEEMRKHDIGEEGEDESEEEGDDDDDEEEMMDLD